MNENLDAKRKVIRSLLENAHYSAELVGHIIREVDTEEKADRFIDYLNHPEKYPRGRYTNYRMIINGTPVEAEGGAVC